VREVEQTDSRSIRSVREVEILDEGVEERGVSSVGGAFASTRRWDRRAMFVGGRVDGRVGQLCGRREHLLDHPSRLRAMRRLAGLAVLNADRAVGGRVGDWGAGEAETEEDGGGLDGFRLGICHAVLLGLMLRRDGPAPPRQGGAFTGEREAAVAVGGVADALETTLEVLLGGIPSSLDGPTTARSTGTVMVRRSRAQSGRVTLAHLAFVDLKLLVVAGHLDLVPAILGL